MSPGRLPEGATSCEAHLAWLERRRDEAWALVLACTSSSFFVAEGGRLVSCGTEDDGLVRNGEIQDANGMLGHSELGADDSVVLTNMLLPSMAGIRFSSLSPGLGFNAAVSAAGKVYAWDVENRGRLGHGDLKGSLVPELVQALEGHAIRSVSAGRHQCFTVTKRGEVFS